MAYKTRKGLLIVGGLIVVVVLALAAVPILQTLHQSPPPLQTRKQAQLSALQDLAQRRASFGSRFNPQTRKATLRDSGRKGVGLFMHNVYFRIAGAIGFDASRLSALLVPTQAGQPVILDDPTSFVFHPLAGRITMPPKALAALFNQYLADYPDTQIRKISVTTSQGRLAVDGEMSNLPGVWLPFHMAGGVRIEQGHLFVLKPDTIKVASIGAKGLLNLLQLQVASLLRIKTLGANIKGNNVVLDLNRALPPPRQNLQVSKMRVDKAGVHLRFASKFNPDFPEPVVKSDSYALFQGGDIKTFRALLTNVRLQLVAADGGKLDTSLYNYRQQIINGHFNATPGGALVAHLGAFRPADYVAPARPGDKHGS